MSTIDERMQEVGLALDDYESSSSLPRAAPPGTEEELDGYLNMPLQKVKTIQSTECAEVGYRLAQFSTYIQRLFNVEKARHTWAEGLMHEIAAPHMASYDKYTKYDHKMAMIAIEVSSVARLKDIIRYAEQRMHRLEFLSDRIYKMAQVVENLRRERIANLRINGVNHE